MPNSEIQIRRVETGPRAGEYLFTPETLSRLPEFYAKVKGSSLQTRSFRRLVRLFFV
ncbi:MAG: hypothetical protein IPL99_11565 [Candidatus Competibacteraceae bacterium]|nr:hypothetical protein [Candidatus Competibacteraceae bacterium]